MKARIPAVISILALAAWLPIQAQQVATPNTASTQTQTTAAPEQNKDTGAHSCCHPKAQAGQEAVAPKPDQAAMECCHGKDAAKASCCAGKEAKDMACCGQKDAAGKTAANCCEGEKGTMCAAKNGKTCCGDMGAKDGKGCCAGMTDHCAAHANSK